MDHLDRQRQKDREGIFHILKKIYVYNGCESVSIVIHLDRDRYRLRKREREFSWFSKRLMSKMAVNLLAIVSHLDRDRDRLRREREFSSF